MTKRVLLVDDSAAFRTLLQAVLSEEAEFELVGFAVNGNEAVERALLLKPDLVLMDVALPLMDGIAATRTLMKLAPCPIVVISSQVEEGPSTVVFEALEAGAVEVISKSMDLQSPAVRRQLAHRLLAMASLKVIRRTGGTRGEEGARLAKGQRILALGASTGGPPALAQVIKDLKPSYRLPIIVAQHLATGFAASFGHWLSETTARAVHVVRDPVPLCSGCIYLAADGHHLLLEGDRLKGVGAEATQVSPSVDRLFESLLPLAPDVVAVLLTGMGADGGQGLLKLRARGAFTLVQDEASSLVYGMPRVAKELGAAAEELPLSRIGLRLLQLEGAGRKTE